MNIAQIKPIIHIYAIIILSVCSGCQQDLNLDQYRNPEVEKMLVVNTIINPDSVIGVSVTNPYFFSDPHIYFQPVTSLDVRVTREKDTWESLTYNPENGLYLSTRKPSAGEVVRLRINEDSHTVVACDTVPHKVEIENVDVTCEGPMHIYWDTDYRFTYQITFQDPRDEENFYFLEIEDDALSYEVSQMGQVDYSTDYVFQVLANMINHDMQGWQPEGVFGYPFSDKGIEGERYTITVTEVVQTPLVSMIERLPRNVNLYSISKAYFDYMVSVLAMDYEETAFKGILRPFGVIEPTKIYSNIEGGTGLMGCYNLSRKKVDILQLSGGWPSK